MGVKILDDADGVVTVRLTGKLRESELLAMQNKIAAIIRSRGKVSLLVIAEDFDGWEQGGEWNSFTFQEQNDAKISRMAIVGEPKWEASALMFTAEGLRPFPIEYFPPDMLARARAWAMSDGNHRED